MNRDAQIGLLAALLLGLGLSLLLGVLLVISGVIP
jgi:hypothetical protein